MSVVWHCHPKLTRMTEEGKSLEGKGIVTKRGRRNEMWNRLKKKMVSLCLMSNFKSKMIIM